MKIRFIFHSFFILGLLSLLSMWLVGATILIEGMWFDYLASGDLWLRTSIYDFWGVFWILLAKFSLAGKAVINLPLWLMTILLSILITAMYFIYTGVARTKKRIFVFLGSILWLASIYTWLMVGSQFI